MNDFTPLSRRSTGTRVAALLLQHLRALALLVYATLTDKVCRLEDVLPTYHNFAQLVRRVAGGFIKTTIVLIHLLLDIFRAILLILHTFVDGTQVHVR